MGADLGVPLSDLRPLCVSVAGGESRKTFTQFSKRENVKTAEGKLSVDRRVVSLAPHFRHTHPRLWTIYQPRGPG